MNQTNPPKDANKVKIPSKQSSTSTPRGSPMQKKKLVQRRAQDRNPLTMLKREAFADLGVFKFKKKPQKINTFKETLGLSQQQETPRQEIVPITGDSASILKAFKLINPHMDNNALEYPQIKKRMALYGIHFSEKEFNLLTGGKSELKPKHILNMTEKVYLQTDPLEKTFEKLYPEGHGSIHIPKLRKILLDLGKPELDEQDEKIIHEFLDLDQDEKISVKDIENAFNYFSTTDTRPQTEFLHRLSLHVSPKMLPR